MLGNLFGSKKDMPQAPVPPVDQGGMAPGQADTTTQSAVPVPPPTGGNTQPVATPPPVDASPAPAQPAADIGGSKMDPALRQNLSALSHLDTRTTQILQNAHKEAVRKKQQYIEPEQILLGMLYDEGIFQILDQFSVDVAKISRDLQQKEVSQQATGQPTLSNDSVQIFEQAYRNAKGRGVGFVEPLDMLLAIYTVNPKLAEYLKAEGVSKEQLDEKLQKSSEYSVGKKSSLEKYGIDLTSEAAAGKLDPVVGREKEVERLVHILLRRTKNNPIIIGEAGVGKTAIIEGLAQQIVQGTVPSDLGKRRIIQLDVSSLVAGASKRGEFEERLREVIKDAMAQQGQVILFIDEIHTLIGAGGDGGAMDASNIIKPHLARGHFQIIGTTTTAEYRKYFEKDKAFERRFQPIIAEEPDEETAMKMLEVLRPKYEKYHNVVITNEALEASVKLSKKYIGERYLPDKAVDLLDEAAAEVKLAQARAEKGAEVLADEKDEEAPLQAGEETAKVAEASAPQTEQQQGETPTPDGTGASTAQGSAPQDQTQQQSAPLAPGETAQAPQGQQPPAEGQQETPQSVNAQTTDNVLSQTLGTDQQAGASDQSPPAALAEAPQQAESQDAAHADEAAKAEGSDGEKKADEATDGTGITDLNDDVKEKTLAEQYGGTSEEHVGEHGNEVRKKDIEKVVASWTGIPVTKLTEDEGKKLLELEDRIHQRLIDQEHAVTAVSEAVRRGRIGLASGARPIASFIFLGPSGTGKTELAKTLSEILFGRDDAIIRLDMSEYMEKHEVAKLIGAPPGYVGYEEGGQLTEAVRAKPYSIVLLDEVEKAHPDVFNILLQLLEDGRLTDNKGNTISFKNTIVICTSNIGSAMIVQKLGEDDKHAEKTEEQEDKDYQELSGKINDELRKFFRPELLNRFDDIVIFKPLRRRDMAGIAKLGIKKTAKLLKEQGFGVQITNKGLQQLAKEGYDPMYGARPLRRLIQTSIENPIAVLIIGKTFSAGDIIVIDYDDQKNEYLFTKSPQSLKDKEKGTADEENTQSTEQQAAPAAGSPDEGAASPDQAAQPATDGPEGDGTNPQEVPPVDPNQPTQPGGAGDAMAVPNAQQVNPADVPAGVESLLGQTAQTPVEQPFDPLSLVSSDSVKPQEPAGSANPPTEQTPPPPAGTGNAMSAGTSAS